MKVPMGIVAVLALLWPACSQAATVHLTSLEWPPYTTASDGHGASHAVVQAAFAAMGVDVEIRYMPWQRALLAARTDPTVDGVFPTYGSKERDAYCHWSSPIGQSPVGLAERKDAPVVWNELSDLKDTPLGVVQGYVNTPALDAMIDAGQLNAEKGSDDAGNLRKLLARRLKAVVIDRNVMRYLLASDPSLHGGAEQLHFNSHLLETKPLFVCFRKDQTGLNLARTLDEGLHKIAAEKIAARALENLGW